MRDVITVLIFSSLLFLGACGGGGGGDDAPAASVSEGATNNATPIYSAPDITESDEVANNDNPNEVEETPGETVPVETTPVQTSPNEPVDPNDEFASTALLEVPSDYDWKMEFSLPIEVSLQANQKAFLSVCTDYSLVDGVYLVNYTSCILRTSVTNNFSGMLNVSNDKKKLIAVVWYLDPAVAPYYQEWATESSQDLPFIMSAI